MTEFFQDAWGNVGKTKFKCMLCHDTGVEYGDSGVEYSETCLTCGGFGFVCKEADEQNQWAFEE